MPAAIDGIDHPVIAVRDMDRARAAYERLGFTIPARGTHVEWSTGNWCIMFADDYLELRGVVDAERPTHGLDRFLAEREGLIGIAFSATSADRAYAAAVASGLHPRPLSEVTRNFELPQGTVQPRFRLAVFEEGEAPGLMSSLVCEHLTPHLIRRPEWLRHANGAEAVRSVTAVVESPAALAPAHARLFGEEAVRAEGERTVVTLKSGATVVFATPAAARRRGESLPGVAPPYLAQVALRVRDVAATAACLEGRGVPFARQRESLRVAPAFACGAVLRFEGDRG